MPKQTYFDDKCLKDSRYDWLDTCDNDRTAFKCRLCCKVLKLLLLSHGQATVERGFSVNKEMIVENQQEQSLVARRVIKDHIFM